MYYSIYKLTAPNGKVYIGRTKQTPNKRWNNGYSFNSDLASDICKFGWDSFEKEVIDTAETREEAIYKESNYIFYFNTTNKEKVYNQNKQSGSRRKYGKILDKQRHEEKIIHNITLDKYYGSIIEAAKDIHIIPGTLSKALKENRKVYGKYEFEEIEQSVLH